MAITERIRKRNPEAWEATGGLSSPAKMPCLGISLPAKACNVGARLVNVDGSTCSNCYALKGRYIMPNVTDAMSRRLDALRRGLMDGTWERAMVSLIKDPKASESGYFRWHDSGDLQSYEHLEAIARIATATPNVKHWLPTREARLVNRYLDAHGAFPVNLCVRLSLPLMDMERPASFDPRIPTSTAHTGKRAPQGARECPAPKQDGHCGPCRACWNHKVQHVSYHKH